MGRKPHIFRLVAKIPNKFPKVTTNQAYVTADSLLAGIHLK